MKRIMLAAAALVVSAGAATAVQTATAATAAPSPAGVTAHGMTYQPGAHVPKTHLPRVEPFNGTLNSGNWAGYADVACPTCVLRYVAASYTVPSVDCARSPDGSYAGFFVGLDGVSDSTVEQIGTTASCSGGAATYLAFFEMFPQAPVAYKGVSPGDAISANVYYNTATKHWQLSLFDLTNGGSITTAQTCPSGSTCRNASAEVITEAPSSSTGSVLPLAEFGQVNNEGIQVTSLNGTHGSMASNSLWTADSLNMVNNSGSALALPGPAYAGQAFQVTWHAAS